jgi:hypothetical protein
MWFRWRHLCKGIAQLFDCKFGLMLQLDDIRILFCVPTRKKKKKRENALGTLVMHRLVMRRVNSYMKVISTSKK